MAYTSQLVLLRKRVLKIITDLQISSSFEYNDFTARESHIPVAKLAELGTKRGLVWVIGWVVDDKDRKTRGPPRLQGGVDPLVDRDVIVQVGYQQSDINPDEILKLDTLLALQEQLRDAIKNGDYENIFGPEDNCPTWIRNEVLKDEDGVPYHYYMLREGNTFETYFNAWFSYPHQ